ncbi:MAG: hypothetical protein LBI96_02815 [Odoribacteraceae bacterium]|jgi:alpha-glucosidase|nr:hypothetical protein [Odoribacteraceae bacterium]
MKYVILFLLAGLTFPSAAQPGESLVIPPPASLGLHAFYKKYLNANGIHIIASRRVPDSAMFAARRTLLAMTAMLPPPVLRAMTDVNTRVGIMARYEGTTDIPEHAHLAADTSLNWDLRARGLGGDLQMPLTTCAEENLLAYQIDKYHAEDILVHEFSHSIHLIGIISVYPAFNDELQAALDAALAAGKWKNTYAATDIAEYWAEGVQDWFNVNAEVKTPDGKHNRVNTREELKRYDRRLYDLIHRFFPESRDPISRHSRVNKFKNQK